MRCRSFDVTIHCEFKLYVERRQKYLAQSSFSIRLVLHKFLQIYSWCSTYGPHLTFSLIFFLLVWIKYLTFYNSKVLFLPYLKVLLFYKFDFLEQYLREAFNTTSGFHFETKSSISGSHFFICLHYWMEVSRLFSIT